MKNINSLTFILYEKNHNITKSVITKCIKTSFKISILQKLKNNCKKSIMTNCMNF